MAQQYPSFQGIELTADDQSIVTNVLTIGSDPTVTGLAAPIGSLALTTNGKTSLSTSDTILIEDSADSNNKKYATIQAIVDLVSTSASLPYYEYFQDLELDVVTSTAPITVLSATTQSLEIGKYRLAWAYEWNSARLLKSFISEVLIDGVIVSTHYEAMSEVHPDNEYEITCNDQQVPTSEFLVLDFQTQQTHTVELRIRTEDLSYQISIWNKIIELQRVA
jgi:hypothetical protein